MAAMTPQHDMVRKYENTEQIMLPDTASEPTCNPSYSTEISEYINYKTTLHQNEWFHIQ